jgi:hypothetical protein
VGDVLDFAVGFGANGNFFGDTTGLFAAINASSQPPPPSVPEPGTAVLLLSGIAIVLGTSRPRNRSARLEA